MRPAIDLHLQIGLGLQGNEKPAATTPRADSASMAVECHALKRCTPRGGPAYNLTAHQNRDAHASLLMFVISG